MNTSPDEGVGDSFIEPAISPSEIILNGVQLDQVKYFGHKRSFSARRQLSFDELDFKRDHTERQQSTTFNTIHSKSHFSEKSGQIFISNLHSSITDRDLVNIFSIFGKLIRSAINYEFNGRSNGTAFVVYEQKKDASMAYRALNGQSFRGLLLYLNYIHTTEQNSDFSSDVKSLQTKILNQNKVPKKSVVDRRRRPFWWSEKDEHKEKEDNDEDEDDYHWKRFKP